MWLYYMYVQREGEKERGGREREGGREGWERERGREGRVREREGGRGEEEGGR